MGDYVGRCHCLASLLEVSSYPKPGNIHRLRDSPDTTFEHFLAGSVATTPALRDLATVAHELTQAEADLSKLGLGDAIHRAVQDMVQWQSGGNVQLGVLLLNAPLAAAYGALGGDSPSAAHLRESVKNVISRTLPTDTQGIYRAIDLAMPRRVLGEAEEMDVTDESSMDRITREGLKPVDVFSLCENRDSICREWVTGFEITFTEGYPYLSGRVEDGEPINLAVVKTFLHLLAHHPDSLITRKSGADEAHRVSKRAAAVLRCRTEPEFKEELWRMDKELWLKDGALNPGTTADLTAASIFVLLLLGWRP